ncbi:phosphoribosylamine--glycine ligase [Ruminococcaceae bacterium OttesenSCG-928-L11]|nr:phosphoribosylamine--glycine ligase [Ruminococcaceae bacterium OttesenSCG-928-L11]
MKVLVVGGGGREHAIIKKLKESPRVTALYAAPGNGGIGRDAECVPIKATDVDAMVAYAVEHAMDFVVVAPDDPLVLGMVDAMNARGIPCFGPTKAAARIEGSKVFSKGLMQKYGIPTAAYETFSDPDAAIAYIRAGTLPVVIKADGLALGKGVIIAETLDEAVAGIDGIMRDKQFGESGNRVVIEEFMTGPEVTVLAFTDGTAIVPMVSSMDHKRALDGNKGLNTGGMGTIAPNPHYDDATAALCMETIFLPTISAMAKEGCPFKGCLYFGLMLTPKGPRVIEYNCRFGDPETQVVLPLLDSDLFAIMEAVSQGRLAEADIRWKPGAAACVVIASGGYPGKYQTGLAISGLDADGNREDACVYHAGTTCADGGFHTAGGRVLGVTAVATSLEEALADAYSAVDAIHFADRHFRTDIGKY